MVSPGAARAPDRHGELRQMTEKKGWNRRLIALGGGAAALGAGYAALRPSGTRPTAKAPVPVGLLRRGNVAEPDTLDPALASAVWEDNIMGDLLVGLTADDPDCNVVPGMAERWETSPDGLTWTFHLREALWSDGQPVTADDFVFGWRRLLDPKTAGPYAYFIYLFKNAEAVNTGKLPLEALGVRAIDARTLEIVVEHPAPYLPEMLKHNTCYPQPRHVIEAKGKAWTRPGNFVGNGAFVLKEWIPNGHVTVVKNPRFYDATEVSLERVVFYPTDDYDAALQRLRAGELDEQDRLPGQQIDWIRANMPELMHQVPQLITDMIAVNHTLTPFNDPRVRRAITLLINREALTGKVRRVGEIPAYSLVPPRVANYPGGPSLAMRGMPQAQKLEQARDLMRAAGFGADRPLRTSLLTRSTAAGLYRATAAALQQMLALGWVQISLVPNDAQIFYSRIQYQDFEMAWPGWNADFNDASNFLDLLRTNAGNNWGKYSNPAFDAALDAAQNERDIVRRGQKLAEAEAIALKDDAVMPIFFWVSNGLVRPYIKGWNANAVDRHRSRWISIDEEARRRTLAT